MAFPRSVSQGIYCWIIKEYKKFWSIQQLEHNLAGDKAGLECKCKLLRIIFMHLCGIFVQMRNMNYFYVYWPCEIYFISIKSLSNGISSN